MTALNAANSFSFLDDDQTQRVVEIASESILAGETPKLLDEWQTAPAQIPDTIINRIIRRSRPGAVGPEVRLATPSGVVTAGAVFDADTVTATSLFRTARVLMRGQVAVID
ncbi:hypothetical protein [Brevibacterium sp. 'Marine']|uniref:hypothetical protein n=1 Tax=unclassified Brevibacterium TaxID=2614124 RepID=UPI002006DDC0|nr:hypothetical protein [Brevibacterium sp. 'Marine']